LNIEQPLQQAGSPWPSQSASWILVPNWRSPGISLKTEAHRPPRHLLACDLRCFTKNMVAIHWIRIDLGGSTRSSSEARNRTLGQIRDPDHDPRSPPIGRKQRESSAARGGINSAHRELAASPAKPSLRETAGTSVRRRLAPYSKRPVRST